MLYIGGVRIFVFYDYSITSINILQMRKGRLSLLRNLFKVTQLVSGGMRDGMRT